MKEVLKKGLLVVLAIMLCAMPVVAFSGCDNDNIVEITNVQTVNNYSPHNNTIWYNKTTQRIVFYTLTRNSSGMSYLTKHDLPSVSCNITFEQERYIE